MDVAGGRLKGRKAGRRADMHCLPWMRSMGTTHLYIESHVSLYISTNQCLGHDGLSMGRAGDGAAVSQARRQRSITWA